MSESGSRVRFVIKSARDPLAEDGPNVIRNLRLCPKRISSVYVYDQVGSELFEQQCLTPEYYLRRAETVLLKGHATEIVRRCGDFAVVELGAGTAEKTGILLAEYAKRGLRCDYFPIDVDVETLTAAAHRLAREFPHLYVHCLGGTYEECLAALPRDGRQRLFLFLGSSLGNMEWSAQVNPGDGTVTVAGVVAALVSPLTKPAMNSVHAWRTIDASSDLSKSIRRDGHIDDCIPARKLTHGS